MQRQLKLLEAKKNSLLKKDIDLIVSDFDNTIFSTNEIVASGLIKGRGNDGNKYLKEVIGIEKFIDLFYKDKKAPKTILSKLRVNHDLILSAGHEDIQKAKFEALGIEHFNYKIVAEAEDKIIELIKYIVNTLEYIPHKITIYEDKPDFFVENKKLIEDFLGTKLEIMFVEMIDNESEPKISEIV